MWMEDWRPASLLAVSQFLEATHSTTVFCHVAPLSHKPAMQIHHHPLMPRRASVFLRAHMIMSPGESLCKANCAL